MKKNCFVITSLLAAFVVNICLGATIDESKFFAHLKMTTSGYAGKSTLNDFPVLVKLSEESIKGFLYGHCSEGGKDIVFIDASGNIIPHEIEVWDTNGTSYIWVKLPELVNEETYFTMHYGVLPSDFGNIPSVNPQDVWTKYVAVFHGGDTIYDSTGNATSVTTNGVSGYVSGVVGGDMFKGTDQVKGVEFTNPKKLLNSSLDFTFSGWFNSKNSKIGTADGTIILASNKQKWEGAGYLALVEMGEYLSVAAQQIHQPSQSNNLGGLTPGEWGYLAFSIGGTQLDLYAEGESIYSTTTAIELVDSNPKNWCLGGYVNNTMDSYVGEMDEVRYYNGIASSDWIKAEYDSVKYVEDFISFGSGVEYIDELMVLTKVDFVETLGEFSIYLCGIDRPTNVSLFYGRSMDKLSKVDFNEIINSTILTKKIPLSKGSYVGFVRLTQNIDGEQIVKDFDFNSFTVNVWNRPQTMYKAFNVMIDYNGEPVDNVPVLFRISAEKIPGFRYADVKEKQFEFVSEDGTLLPYEIDTWDENGESLIWIKLPHFAKNQKVTVRYGGVLSNAILSETKVWSDYVGVWHMNETNKVSSLESTPNSTANEGLDAELAAVSKGGYEGVFGNSIWIRDCAPQTENQRLGGLYVHDSGENSPLDVGSNFAVSGWFKHNPNRGLYYDNIFYKRKKSNNTESPTGGFAIEMKERSDIFVDVRGSSNSYSSQPYHTSVKAGWSYLTFVYDGSVARIYQNGVYCGKTSIGKVVNNDAPFSIGNNSASYSGTGGNRAWLGWVDEVRLLPVTPTDDYIAAEYAAMTDESIISYGEVNSISWESMIYFK